MEWKAQTFASAQEFLARVGVEAPIVGLFDPRTKQLLWRGSASKTLDVKKDPTRTTAIWRRPWTSCLGTIRHAPAGTDQVSP
jgi:hypothetical protein